MKLRTKTFLILTIFLAFLIIIAGMWHWVRFELGNLNLSNEISSVIVCTLAIVIFVLILAMIKFVVKISEIK